MYTNRNTNFMIYPLCAISNGESNETYGEWIDQTAVIFSGRVSYSAAVNLVICPCFNKFLPGR